MILCTDLLNNKLCIQHITRSSKHHCSVAASRSLLPRAFEIIVLCFVQSSRLNCQCFTLGGDIVGVSVISFKSHHMRRALARVHVLLDPRLGSIQIADSVNEEVIATGSSLTDVTGHVIQLDAYKSSPYGKTARGPALQTI